MRLYDGKVGRMNCDSDGLMHNDESKMHDE